MKTLIYSSALLYLLILGSSCNKGDLVPPNKPATQVQVARPKQAPCDSSKSVNFYLNNSTGIASFQVAFFSPNNTVSWFDFPADGSKSIAIKPGIYTIQVYPAGDYSPHHIFINDQAPVIAPGARFTNISISSCSASYLNASIK